MITRKKLSTLSLIAALALAPAGLASTMYVDGVTSSAGLTYDDLLNDGWIMIYNEAYGTGIDSSEVTDWQTLAGTRSVFVGALDVDGNVVVGATGLASEVLSPSTSLFSATQYSSSNLYWYNRANYSFGFTPTENIYLAAADVTGFFPDIAPDDGLNDLRLSWHTVGSGAGGYRAGSVWDLNTDTSYRKIVLIGDANSVSVPEATPSVTLFGLAVIGLLGLRRRIAR